MKKAWWIDVKTGHWYPVVINQDMGDEYEIEFDKFGHPIFGKTLIVR